jgi:predicted NBD/HSP70 family sugar kinase
VSEEVVIPLDLAESIYLESFRIRGPVETFDDDPTDARNARHLRRANLERILAEAMSRPGAFTRAELIDATGLSAPTVGSLTRELIRKGVVRDLGTGPARVGRRPSFMEFSSRFGFVAGIDLGPTTSRVAVADLRGDLLGRRELRTPHTGPKPILSSVVAALRGLMAEVKVPEGRLLSVAVGAPGSVDQGSGMVVQLAPNLKGWSHVPVGEILSASLTTPVIVENDVNLAVLGEHWRGVARGHGTCAYITAGTGIGAGVLVDGTLHRGHHSLAGEIALMCMGPQYVDQDFGPNGCLESLTGLKALAGRWSRGGIAPPEVQVRRILDAAARSDRAARRIVRDVSTLLGIAATNLSLVLDPSLIVFGGAIVAQNQVFVDEIRRIVAKIIPSPPQIEVSALGKEATLWGCLLLATTHAGSQLKERLRAGRAAPIKRSGEKNERPAVARAAAL